MGHQMRILFVDDELSPGADEPSGHYMWYYTRALREAGFVLEEASSVDQALAILSKSPTHFDLAILDVLMPPGESLDPEGAGYGMRTGVVLADRIRDIAPVLPLVVLTNVCSDTVLKAFQEKPNVSVVINKVDCTPFQLVDRLRAMHNGQDA
ncbi:MAG: hypothetical protein JSU86_03300 [Phycisphaerales bacterium]|nr:MAG: hypothetical protein JSU86_03300 [Phycisphaerales bacterium]